MDLLPSSNEFVSLFIDGSVVFSDQGIERYRVLFGRAGIDIRQIKDYAGYIQAMRAIRPLEFDDLRAGLTSKGESLDTKTRLLDAILELDDATIDQMTAKQERNKKVGLRVIRGEKKED